MHKHYPRLGLTDAAIGLAANETGAVIETGWLI
jgi:hypothetical protein